MMLDCVMFDCDEACELEAMLQKVNEAVYILDAEPLSGDEVLAAIERIAEQRIRDYRPDDYAPDEDDSLRGLLDKLQHLSEREKTFLATPGCHLVDLYESEETKELRDRNPEFFSIPSAAYPTFSPGDPTYILAVPDDPDDDY